MDKVTTDWKVHQETHFGLSMEVDVAFLLVITSPA